MLLSRFWYGVLALALGAAVFVLFVAAQLYNRSSHRAMSEALSADSSAVEWFLNDDARKRSSALIRVALNPALRTALAKSSTEAKPGAELREKARTALRTATAEVPAELKFDHGVGRRRGRAGDRVGGLRAPRGVGARRLPAGRRRPPRLDPR